MKGTEVHELAVLGGPPAFSQPLHVGRPNLPQRDRVHELLDTIFDRRWLTNRGPLVQEFESRLQRHLGVKHCVAVCNATVGLEVAARALGLTGEVIVPAFTFVATAHALRWIGLEPVFCDVDPVTHTMAPDAADRLVTAKTSAILGVHMWGRVCDVDALAAVAARHRIQLLFDAAHAFSSTHRGSMAGGFGALEVFSFHATKFLNTFEGGAIATNSDELAKRARLMMNFGFSGYDSVDALGTNGKMSEIAAAMGLAGLENVDDVIAVNRRNHAAYGAALAGIDGLRLMEYDTAERQNYQYLVVTVEPACGLTRDELVEVLWAEGVHARRYFFPGCHRMAPYNTEPRWRGVSLPHTERLAASLLTLPTGTAVTPSDVATVGRIIRTACANADIVRSALRGAGASV